tara:strand:- start:5295 stop:8681 length:3387 start_codon:yes stop_codon:yes gene_type:complete
MDESLLAKDFAARDDALDVTRSFIIQAPAGSGKTELLIQRYLNLLAVVQHPEEIIAITFTRKAAAEMQLRVLDALRRAASGNAPQQDHERRTFELASSALARSAKLSWDLVGNPRRMRIMTLDSLNRSILRSQALRPNGTGASVVDGAAAVATYRDAALATLDWLAESGEFQAAAREVLQHVDTNTRLYASYLAQMLATRDQWLPFIGSGLLDDADAAELRQRFEASLELAVSEHLQRVATRLGRIEYAELDTLLDYAGRNFAETEGDGVIACLAGLEGLPPPETMQVETWKGIAELLLTKEPNSSFRKRVNKNQGFPAGEKPRKALMHELLQGMAGDKELLTELQGVRFLPPLRYSDEQWSVLLALFRILPLAVSELNRLFSEQGVVDYTDVALSAAAALGTAEDPGDIALLLDYQVKHLLVDEMQDTSAAQYRMLETLVGGWQDGDGRTLCCVGDPMQSIYRFRNAEVGQFLLAQEFGVGHVRLQRLLLRRNFRSGEKLVDWFNGVFPDILAQKDDALRGAVSYASAVPVPQAGNPGQVGIYPVFGGEVMDEAQRACDLIATTLADHPDDDMAVLVRGRTQLPQLLALLRKANIAYRAVEIDRLTDLPEIIDVLNLTRAAAHQADRTAWLGILRGPWIGLHWSDLHTLVRNDKASTIWELLHNPDRLDTLSESGKALLEASLPQLELLVRAHCGMTLRDRVERTWMRLGGPGILQDEHSVENVYRFFDVISKLEQAGTLMDVADLESALDLERVSSNEKSRLQIMTMHRAKGLQFDHVLLYALGRQPGHGDKRVLSWFDLPAVHGHEYKVISPVGPQSEVDNDPVHQYIVKTEAGKARHEHARLLYVACTRARKSLHLMGNTELAADGDSVRAARSDSLLHLLWPAVKSEFDQALANYREPAAASIEAEWMTPELRRFRSRWTVPEIPQLPGIPTQAEAATPVDEVEFYWVGSDARIAGTLVHRWLQLIADGFARNAEPNLSELRQITERWLREHGIDGSAAEPIVERVVVAVRRTVENDKGAWILRGEGHTELGLSGLYRDELVSVVLDRVRVDEDGTHWIIDYKTSSHEGGNLPAFVQAEVERYTPQLERYASIYANWSAATTKCALYFPLLSKFVEVEIDAKS